MRETFSREPTACTMTARAVEDGCPRRGLPFLHREVLPHLAKIFVLSIHGDAAGKMKQIARAHALDVGAYRGRSIINGVAEFGKSLTYFIHKIEFFNEGWMRKCGG